MKHIRKWIKIITQGDIPKKYVLVMFRFSKLPTGVYRTIMNIDYIIGYFNDE